MFSTLLSITRSTPSVERALFVAAFVLAAISKPSTAPAQTTYVWDGNTNANWTEPDNWDLNSGVPGSTDTAVFDSAGNGNTTIDIGAGGGAITISDIIFDTASAASYTIGENSGGTDVLTFNSDGGIELTSSLTSDQIIASDIIIGLGSETANSAVVNNSSAQTLNLNGDIDLGITSGTQNFRFDGGGNTTIAGNISNSGGGNLQLFARQSSNIVLAGTTASGTTITTLVQDDATITVNSGGSIGEGAMQIHYGTVNLNNATQTLGAGLFFGSSTAANGNSSLALNNSTTVALSSDITYTADDTTDNQSFISDGTLQFTGGDRIVTVNDNTNGALNDDTVAELTISSDITNDGSSRTLFKRGQGTLLLSGANTHGNTIIENGRVVLGSDTALSPTNTLTVRSQNAAPGGVDSEVILDLAGSNVTATSIGLGNSSTSTFGAGQTPMIIDSAGTGLLRMNSNLTYNAGSAGNLNGTATISADMTWTSNRAFTVNNGGSAIDLIFSGEIVHAGLNPNALIKNGGGTLLLTGGAKSEVNTILHRAGIIQFTGDDQLSSGDVVIGFNSTTATLEYVGTGGSTNNRIDLGRSGTVATYTGGAVILANGTGALTFSNGTFNDDVQQVVGITRNIALGGDNTDDNTISGVISNNFETTNGDGLAPVSVTKQGSGKWILNGANTYTGGTTIESGRLDIGGINTGTGDVTVNAGASLGGEGSVAGNVTIGTGASSANLFIDPSTAGAFTTSGDLDVSNGVTVFFDQTATTTPVNVITYGGTLTGTTGDFTLDASANQSARGASFSDVAKTIQLDLGFEDLTWENTTTDGLWNINSSANWTGGDTVFFDGDNVTFLDTGAGTVTVEENVVVGTALFENDTTAYIINDDGGSETLTVNDRLIFRGNADATVNAIISGAGSLTLGDENDGVSDGANLTLTAANTFTGGVLITEGQLRITDSDALGTGAVIITDAGSNANNEPSLELDANNLIVPNDITLSNDGFVKRIRFDISGSGNNAELSGTITLNETLDRITAITAGNGETLTISGIVTGAGVLNAATAPGTIRLTNELNDFTGVLMTRGSSVVEVTSIGDIGSTSAAGAGSFITLGYRNENGTFRYAGSGDTTNKQIRVGEDFSGSNRTGGGTLESSGTGAVVFTNSAFNQPEVAGYVGVRPFTLGGTNTDNNEIQGTIADNNDGSNDVAINLFKDGTGNWILSGNSTYSGTTTISNGTLIINGNNSAANGNVTVSSTGTLGGGGTIGGATDIAGSHFAGAHSTAGAVSQQTFTNNLTYSGGSSSVTWDLINHSVSDPGVNFDQFVIGGDLSFSGTTNLSLNFNGDGAGSSSVDWDNTFWHSDRTWVLYDVTGTLSGSPILVTESWLDGAGDSFSASIGSFALNTSGNDIVLNFTTAVPEPGTYAVMGLSLAGFGWIIRRRRMKREICDQ